MKFQAPEMTEAQCDRIHRALSLYRELTALDDKVEAKALDIKQADALHELAAKALAQRDRDLALATDDASARVIELDVEKLTAELSEAQADLARKVRVHAALLNYLSEKEAGLEAEKTAFQDFVRIYGSEMLRVIGEHIAQAARPLIEALRLAAVTSTAMGVPIGGRLLELHVPDLRNNGMLLNGLTLTGYIDGSPVRLLEVGDDRALADLCRFLGQPQQVLKELGSYRSRATRWQEQQRAQIFQPSTSSPDPRDRIRP